jgi:hypothetical protein
MPDHYLTPKAIRSLTISIRLPSTAFQRESLQLFKFFLRNLAIALDRIAAQRLSALVQ